MSSYPGAFGKTKTPRHLTVPSRGGILKPSKHEHETNTILLTGPEITPFHCLLSVVVCFLF